MRLSISCETCKIDSLAECESDNTEFLGAMIVACHGSGHPSPHRLLMEIDKKQPEKGKHTAVFRCLLPDCTQGPRELTYNVRIELISACAIAFHTHHEGHALQMIIDGVQIHPPENA